MLKRPILFFASLLIISNLSLFLAYQKPEQASADIGGLASLINQYRVSNGLGTLTEDANLTKAACWLTNDMAANNYFDHTDSLGRNFSTRLTEFGVTGGTRGENIASLTNQANSAQKVFNGWENSPGHKANMLNPAFSRIGVGDAYRSSNVTYYWSADFASGAAIGSTNGCSTDTSPPPPPSPNPLPPKAVPPPPANPVTNQEPTVTITSIPTATLTPLQKSITSTASPKEMLKKPENKQEASFLAGLIIVNLFLIVPILLVTLL